MWNVLCEKNPSFHFIFFSYKFHCVCAGSCVWRNADCFWFKSSVTFLILQTSITSSFLLICFFFRLPYLILIFTYPILPVISLTLLFAFHSSIVSLSLGDLGRWDNQNYIWYSRCWCIMGLYRERRIFFQCT